MTEYLYKITECLTQIEEKEAENLKLASSLVAKTIENDGIIYIFGCGHSHLPGLDAFYRAGGLSNVSPILDTDLMLHNGAAKSSRMEKMSGLATEIIRRYGLTKKDMLFVLSASGKNQVPYEMALEAKKLGVKTVGISSSSYFEKGGKLHTATDIHIDCLVPYGDASVAVGDVKMGGLSTATNCFIINSCLIEGSKIALSHGVKPPVYLSGNIEGGKDHNILLEERYFKRVKHL